MISLLIILLLGQVAPLPPKGGHYDNSSETYNGIGKFIALAQERKVPLYSLTHLNWEELDPQKSALLFLSPTVPVPPKKLSSFLHKGGLALLAEDFREGSNLFSVLGIPLQREETSFPKAVTIDSDHTWLAPIEQIQTNHPSSFSISKAPILAFPLSGRALMASFEIGEGELWLLADPSLFINDMVDRKDNRKLLIYILESLGRQKRSVYLLRQYTQSGWPKGEEPGDDETHVGLKTLVPMLYSRSKEFLSHNKMGLRLLGLLLLIPFIYAILYFAGSVTLWSQTPLPLYSSVSSHRAEWNRLLALRDLLYEKIALYLEVDPVPMTNHGAIKRRAEERWDRETSRSLTATLRFLSRITDDPHSFPGSWDTTKVESKSDNIEEVIRSMESH